MCVCMYVRMYAYMYKIKADIEVKACWSLHRCILFLIIMYLPCRVCTCTLKD